MIEEGLLAILALAFLLSSRQPLLSPFFPLLFCLHILSLSSIGGLCRLPALPWHLRDGVLEAQGARSPVPQWHAAQGQGRQGGGIESESKKRNKNFKDQRSDICTPMYISSCHPSLPPSLPPSFAPGCEPHRAWHGGLAKHPEAILRRFPHPSRRGQVQLCRLLLHEADAGRFY